MKICFLAHGNSIHTRRWISYFSNKGYETSLVSLTPADPLPGVELYNLANNRHVHQETSRTNWHYLLKLPRLWKLVRHIQPDLINAHFLSSYGILTALVRLRSCPFVISLYGSDILIIPHQSQAHYWAAYFALGQVDMLTSMGQHMTDTLPQKIIETKPILTIQYGVDVETYSFRENSADRRPVCLSNRNMVSNSNIDTIISAVRHLKEEKHPFSLDIAGQGELEARLRQKVGDLDLQDSISFLGYVDQEHMAQILQSVAIYVSMTASDGTSLSLLEAMACGAFPVVSDIAANRQLITDGVNGFLVPLNSPAQLAQKLQEALYKTDLRRSAAHHNRSLIVEQWNYQKNMSIIEAKFKRLVQE